MMKNIITKKYFILLLLLTFISPCFAMESKEYDLEALYSCTRKLESPNLYEDITINEKDTEDFIEYAKKYYKEQIPIEWKDKILELFDGNMKIGNNLYEPLAENLIQEMYQKQKSCVEKILPVGIIQNQPILKDQPSETIYSLGTGMLYNNKFIITAKHVLDLEWFQVKENDNIVNSGHLPSNVIKKQLTDNKIFPINKTLVYIPFKDEKNSSEIEKVSYVEDKITYKGIDKNTFEIVDITENGIDIGIAKLQKTIPSEFKISFSEDIAKYNKDLFTISIERTEEGEKLFLIKQPDILTFKQIKALEDRPQYQKMFFLKNAMIPGNSGSAILASIEDRNLLIFGVFSKKIEVVDDGRIKLMFAFSPIKDYIEVLMKKIEEL